MDKLVISYATAILELQKEEGISSKQTIELAFVRFSWGIVAKPAVLVVID